MNAPAQASHIEELVIELIQRIKAEYRIFDGCLAEDVCSRLRLNLVYTRLLDDQDGSCDFQTRTVMVNLKRSRLNERRQFTIFHEIVHFLIDQDGAVIEYLTDTYRDDSNGYRHALEHACNVGAAEFLAPRAQVVSYIDRWGFATGLIPYIRSRHGMSLSAAMRQLASCAPYPCFLVLCRFSHSRLAVPPRDCLCVSLAVAAPQTGYVLVKGTIIPEDHLFHDVWCRRREKTAATYVPFRSGARMPCWGEAKRSDNDLFGILSWNRG